jgi:spore coat protein U-like protein
MKTKNIVFLKSSVLILAMIGLLVNMAQAATATSNLSVTATVAATCTVTTAPVAFGTYNPASGTPTDTTGTITVTCTNGSTYTIALDAGANPSSAGNVTTRRMTAGASKFLSYQLYLDSPHTTIWGDGANGSSINPTSGSFTGDGTAQGYSVYGRITTGNYVPSGSYTDTVVMTVTYN